MIYDCFMFYRDFDQLEIRLNELSEVVDKFVLVECTKTFRGKDKPLWFGEYLVSSRRRGYPRIEKFLNRIVHVIADDPPPVDVENRPYHRSTSDFSIEYYQRDCIAEGLINCKDDDVILISDADEIPRAELVKNVSFKDFDFWVCMHRMYYYYLNTYFENNPWGGTIAIQWKSLKASSPNSFRIRKRNGKRWTVRRGDSGGWHFSHLVGDKDNAIEKLQEKMRISGHHELDSPDRNNTDNLTKCLSELKSYHTYSGCGKEMKVDSMDFLPKYVQDNPDRFKEYLK